MVLAAVLRLGALSPRSSSECSVLVSDMSELCWDEASSAKAAAAAERAAGEDEVRSVRVRLDSSNRFFY